MGIFTAIFAWAIAAGAFVAGHGYIRTARAMPTWPFTAGTVTRRELGEDTNVEAPGVSYYPRPTYTYVVGERSFSSDRYEYAHRGRPREQAEKLLAAVPDTVQVYFNPEKPSEAYLIRHTPHLGYVFYAAGAVVALVGLAFLLG